MNEIGAVNKLNTSYCWYFYRWQGRLTSTGDIRCCCWRHWTSSSWKWKKTYV